MGGLGSALADRSRPALPAGPAPPLFQVFISLWASLQVWRGRDLPWLYACSRSWCLNMEPAPGSRDWEAGQRGGGDGCGWVLKALPCGCCFFQKPCQSLAEQSEQGLSWPQPQALPHPSDPGHPGRPSAPAARACEARRAAALDHQPRGCPHLPTCTGREKNRSQDPRMGELRVQWRVP